MRKRIGGRRRHRRQDGAAAVEFALIAMVLVTLLFGILQYGWYFFTTQTATSGAREAARRLSVGDCAKPGEAQNFARNQANLASLTLKWGTPSNPSAGTDAGGIPTTMQVGDVLTVTVTADGGILGFVPVPNDGQFTRVVTSRLEDKESSGTC